jgi:hypothetical protein
VMKNTHRLQGVLCSQLGITLQWDPRAVRVLAREDPVYQRQAVIDTLQAHEV